MNKVYILLLICIFSFLLSIKSYAQSPTKISTKPSKAPSATPAPTKIVPSVVPVNGIKLTLSPVFINLVTDPGVSASSEFKVVNEGTETEYLEIKVEKFNTKNGSEAPVIEELANEDVFGKWVEFSDTQFVIPRNGTKTIKFKINPPKDAALGYYYAFVIQRIRGADEKTAGAILSGSPAIPVILEVRSPNAKREIQLVDFKTDKVFYEELPVSFEVAMKNTGNIHVIPVGDIFIDWGDKKEVGILHVNASKGNVLPQSERTFETSWDDGFIVKVPKVDNGVIVHDSHGKPVYETKFDFDKPLSKFRIGKYTAHVLLVYDNGQRDIPMEAKLSFWVIPIRLILILIAIILSPVLLYHIISKLRNRLAKHS